MPLSHVRNGIKGMTIENEAFCAKYHPVYNITSISCFVGASGEEVLTKWGALRK